jgi:hypothetical protein
MVSTTVPEIVGSLCDVEALGMATACPVIRRQPSIVRAANITQSTELNFRYISKLLYVENFLGNL